MSSYPQLHAPDDLELAITSSDDTVQEFAAFTNVCWLIWLSICGLFVFNTYWLLTTGLNQLHHAPQAIVAAWSIALLVIAMNGVCAVFCQLELNLSGKLLRQFLSPVLMMIPGTLLAMECVLQISSSHALSMLFISLMILQLIPYIQGDFSQGAVTTVPSLSVTFPQVDDEELDEEVASEAESASSPLSWMKMEVITSDTGNEQTLIQGGFTINSLQAGEVLYRHIPFIPPLELKPQAELFCDADSNVRAKIAELQNYGMRIEVRSAGESSIPATINFEVIA